MSFFPGNGRGIFIELWLQLHQEVPFMFRTGVLTYSKFNGVFATNGC